MNIGVATRTPSSNNTAPEAVINIPIAGKCRIVAAVMMPEGFRLVWENIETGERGTISVESLQNLLFFHQS